MLSSQLEQEASPEAAEDPASHTLHTVAFSAGARPAPQAVQELEFASVDTLPASQLAQPLLPSL